MKISNRKKNIRKIFFNAGNKTICKNCGGIGPHFIPPSFGSRGVFICDKNENEVMK